MKHYIKTALVRVTTLFALVIMLAAQAQARVWFVKTDGSGTDGSSWGTAVTLDYALKQAATVGGGGDSVLVKYGTYKPASATTNFMIYTNTSMYGGFDGTEADLAARSNPMRSAYKTIISGDLDDDGVNDTTTDAARLLCMTGGNEVVDGFVLQGASPYGTANPTAGMSGTAALKVLGANVGAVRTIRNCVFTKNVAAYGGAICAFVTFTNVLSFENCIFTKNGDPATGSGSCVFYSRYNGPINLKNCVAYGNYFTAEGIWQWRSGTLTMYNTVFFEPTYNGTLLVGAPTTAYGLKRNGGTWGGTYNCAITNGSGTNSWSTYWSNSVSPQYLSSGTMPGFSDAANNDFSITSGSICKDTGTNSYAIAKDIIGNSRPTNPDGSAGISDIGAYEYQAGGAKYSNYVYTKPAGLTVTVNPAASGSDPAVSANIDSGASVSMTSYAQTNGLATTRWIPTNWVNNASSYTDNPHGFNIAADTYWTNNFRVEYKCAAAMSGGGAGCSATVGSTWVTNGDSITFTAVAGSGYRFVKWNEDNNTDLSHTVSISAATTLTAVFELTAIAFHVASVPDGRSFRLDGADQSTPYNGAVSSGNHDIDTAATQTVDTVTQARFKNWTDGLSQLLTPVTTTGLTYSVTQEETLQANFDLYYKLTTNNPTGGTIAIGSPSDDNYYLSGASKTLTANAASGYAFKNWSGDIGSANASDPEITVTMNQGRSIQANFASVLFVTTTGTGSGSSWADATSLTNALFNFTAGGEIWIAGGTYHPVNGTTALALKDSTVIYGGLTYNQGWSGRNWVNNPTIITGDFDGNGVSDMTTAPLMYHDTAGGNTTWVSIDGVIFERGNNTSQTVAGGALGAKTASSQYSGGYRVANSIFRDNTAWGGAAVFVNYNVSTMVNCLFIRNTSTDTATWGAGAISVRRGDGFSLYMTNCTFAANSGSMALDVIAYRPITAVNCIFQYGPLTSVTSVWSTAGQGNPDNFTKCDGAIVSVNGTLTSCVNVDPKFRGAGDYRLKSTSPLVDTGYNTGVTTDLNNNPRPYNGTIDYGCYEAQAFYNNTVNSSPAGRDVVVDGTASVAGPANVVTCEGSVTMTASSTQTVSTTRYIFQNWTDGVNTPVSNPTNTFNITHATNWTAAFATQYKMTVTYNGAQGLVKLASGDALTSENVWTASGGSISLTASALTGFAFDGWAGDTTGDTNSLTMTVTMDAAKALTANFRATAVAVTVKKDAATTGEIRFLVDSQEYTNTWDFNFEPDTVHTVEVVDAVQDWNDDKVGYVWSSWSDGLGRKHEITASLATTLTATMQKQNKWTLTQVGSGTATPVTGWYNDGATFTAEATGAGFTGWSGDISTENGTVSVTMNAPKAVTATFKSGIVYVDAVAGTDAPGNGTAWGTAYKTLPYALDNSAAGSEFWVAKGTYKTLGGTNYMGVQNGDAIYGGFAGGETARGSRNWATNQVIITGDTNGDGTSEMTTQALMRFLGAITQTWTATMDGLIFEYGNNTGVGSASVAYGGAIGADGNASGMYTIRHCIFRYNKAATGDALGLSRGDSIVENCLFYGNGSGASTKAAIYNRRATVRLVNCTMADNVAGDLNTDTTYPIKATNCIFRGSITFDGTGSSLQNCSYSTTPANFTDAGGNNTDAPGFAGTGSYKLGAGSLMQDSGTAVGLGDALDLACKARVSGTIDRGCYEGSYYKVTVTPTAGAVVTFNGQTISAQTDVVVEPNTTYQATRVAAQTNELQNTKYVFSKWTLDSVDGSGSPYDVAVGTANRTLTATFAISYKLGLSVVGNGSVSGATGGNFYSAGSGLSLSASPIGFGSAFTGWSGDLTGSSNPGSLTMNGPKSVTATFVSDGPTAIIFQ